MRRHIRNSWLARASGHKGRTGQVRLLAVAIVTLLALVGPAAARAAHPRASTSPQVIAAAQHAVQTARARVTNFEIHPLSTKPARHKLIVGITCISDGGCIDGILGVQQAGKALGWKTTIIDGKGDPSVWNAAVLNAITIHADAIVLTAVPSFLIQDALQKARAAKIPVISIFDPIFKNDGFYGHVTPDHTAMGRLNADWVIADSKGTAHVIFLEDNAHIDLKMRLGGFEQEFARCAGCKIDAFVQVSDATIYTRLAPAIAAALEQHPDTTYVVGATDGFTPMAVQAIRQIGRSGQIKVSGFDGSQQATGQMHSGDESASVAEPVYFAGWVATDLLVRALAGQAPQDAAFLPTKLLDTKNVPAKGLWDSDFDYRARFLKVWGLK